MAIDLTNTKAKVTLMTTTQEFHPTTTTEDIDFIANLT